MNWIYKPPKPKKMFPLIILVVCFIGVGIANLANLTFNLTPSMKEGFYIKKYGDYAKGDIVSLCLKTPYVTTGLKRSYIQPNGWSCDNAMPLIKQVIAVPGDNVILSDNYISVNGIHYLYKTEYYDSVERPLSVYPRGHYLNTKGYWLIGINDPKSWDSRYWGPVDKNQILSKLKPLLTW